MAEDKKEDKKVILDDKDHEKVADMYAQVKKEADAKQKDEKS